MSESKRFAMRMVPAVLLIVLIHFVLVKCNVFVVAERIAILMELVLSILFLMGTVIIAPSFKKDSDQLVGRFMILTTVQLLSILALFGAFIYVKIPDFRTAVFHSLGLFLILMIVQSVLLVTTINRLARNK